MCSRSLWNIWSVDYNTQNVQKTPSPMLQKGSVREARARLKTNDPSQKKKKKKKKKSKHAAQPLQKSSKLTMQLRKDVLITHNLRQVPRADLARSTRLTVRIY